MYKRMGRPGAQHLSRESQSWGRRPGTKETEEGTGGSDLFKAKVGARWARPEAGRGQGECWIEGSSLQAKTSRAWWSQSRRF